MFNNRSSRVCHTISRSGRVRRRIPRAFLVPRVSRLSCYGTVASVALVRAPMLLFVLLAGLGLPVDLTAASGRIVKVLPQFVDQQGRIALNPSLYERDAYQVYLRQNPEKRSAIRFSVQWASKDTRHLTLKVEMRGNHGRLGTAATIETPVKFRGLFTSWAKVSLEGDAAKAFGDLSAWRATLWDGDKVVAEQKSFLW